jgi:hypothetical protein
MYVFGGWDGGRNFADFHKLSLAVSGMPSASPGQSRRASNGGAGAGMAAAAAAGGGGGDLSSGRGEDQQQYVWTQVIPQVLSQEACAPPSGRRGHSCVVYEGVLLLFGGQDGNNFYNDVYSFQVDGCTWSHVSCAGMAPLSRSYHTAVMYRSDMYVFGGTGANWCFFNDLYLLRLPTSTWSQVEYSGAVPSPRCFHTAVVVGSRLVVFGGARLTRDTWDYFNHLYQFRLAAPQADADNTSNTTLSADLRGLLGSEDFSDITFVVEGRRVFAHKSILCARCEYFRHMLQSGMAESRQKVLPRE